MWKEAAVVYFKVVFPHLSVRKPEGLGQDKPASGPKTEPRPDKY